MDYRYIHVDWRERANQLSREQRMDDVFRELMLAASGDMEAAFSYLDQLGSSLTKTVGFSAKEFEKYLRDRGMIDGKAGNRSLSRKGEQQVRAASLDQVFGKLKAGAKGEHATRRAGAIGDRTGAQRPWQPGDESTDIAYRDSLLNQLRSGRDELSHHDLIVEEREANTSAATVMCLDISHSMTLYGEDRITPAKRVALAFAELQQRQYPRDAFHILLFGDDVREVSVAELPYVTNGPFHTNTCEVLRRAADILVKRRQPNKRVVLVTDGKPTALFTPKGLMINSSPGLDPRIVTATLNQAARYPRLGIELTVFMVASDPYLERFVQRLVDVAQGQALKATLDQLGSQVLDTMFGQRRSRRKR